MPSNSNSTQEWLMRVSGNQIERLMTNKNWRSLMSECPLYSGHSPFGDRKRHSAGKSLCAVSPTTRYEAAFTKPPTATDKNNMKPQNNSRQQTQTLQELQREKLKLLEHLCA